jgi:hypothetical protein
MNKKFEKQLKYGAKILKEEEDKEKLYKCVKKFIRYYGIENEDSLQDNDVDRGMQEDFINECCKIVGFKKIKEKDK